MEELLLGTLSALAGTALGGFISSRNLLRQHQHERRTVAQEKLATAIASTERVLLSLKHVQRTQSSLEQTAAESEIENGKLANELRLTLADNRASMEESLLTLQTICGAYFHVDDVTSRLNDLEATSRNAFASSGEVVRHRESLESVERSIRTLSASLVVGANEYKG